MSENRGSVVPTFARVPCRFFSCPRFVPASGYNHGMFKVEVEQEADGRWIAEVPQLPGVMTYARTRQEALTRAQALSLRVLAERLEHGEDLPEVDAVFSIVA